MNNVVPTVLIVLMYVLALAILATSTPNRNIISGQRFQIKNAIYKCEKVQELEFDK